MSRTIPYGHRSLMQACRVRQPNVRMYVSRAERFRTDSARRCCRTIEPGLHPDPCGIRYHYVRPRPHAVHEDYRGWVDPGPPRSFHRPVRASHRSRNHDHRPRHSLDPTAAIPQPTFRPTIVSAGPNVRYPARLTWRPNLPRKHGKARPAHTTPGIQVQRM